MPIEVTKEYGIFTLHGNRTDDDGNVITCATISFRGEDIRSVTAGHDFIIESQTKLPELRVTTLLPERYFAVPINNDELDTVVDDFTREWVKYMRGATKD